MKKGFAFTVFEDERDAEDAVKALSGRRLKGERVKLEFAKGERRGSDRDRYEAGAGNRVVVENLSSKTAWQDLKESVVTNIIELETLIKIQMRDLGTIYSCFDIFLGMEDQYQSFSILPICVHPYKVWKDLLN